MKKELKKILSKLEKEKIVLSYMGEYELSDRINKLFDKDEICTDEEIAERIAFDFIADYQSELDWNTYYGPKFILPTKDKKKVSIYPHVSQVNKNVIKYWEKRAKETKNPILKSRYADLVVDFKPRVLQQRADVEFYNIVIQSNIEICKNNLADDLSCQTKLKRAFQLELEVKKEISDELKKALIDLDKKGEFDKPGTWGFAFELLVLTKNKKIKLTDEEKQNLFDDILGKFNKAGKNPHILEYTTSLLSRYYKQNNNCKKLHKLLLDFEKFYKSYYNEQDAISKSHGHHKILEIFKIYSDICNNVKEEENRIIKEIGELDLNWEKDLKTLSVETKIDNEKIKQHLDFIFSKDRSNKIDEVIGKIIYLDLPKKENLKQQYEEISSKYVFQHLANQQIIGEHGLVKAQIPSGIDSVDNLGNPKFIIEASRYIQFGLIALSIGLEEFKKNFTKQELFEYLKDKDLFKKIDKNVLERILKAYYDNDYLVFSHLVVPLIEKIIREFIRITNGVWITTNKYHGFESLTLHQLLNKKENQNIFKKVFGAYGEDIIFYLKLVLTEKLGMEIRTDVAHGNDMSKFFSYQISDLLLHILLIFSLVIKKDSE